MSDLDQKSKIRRVPALRFPEFSGSWEEARLGDFLVPTLREVPKPNVPYLALGIRSHFKGTFQKPDSDPDKIAMDTLYSVAEGDLIVNITFAWEGAVAIAKKEDEGGLVSHRFPTYTFDDTVAIRDFFRFVFPRERMKYDLTNVSPGGAGRNRVLNKKDFLKLKTFVPSIPEQQKIAGALGAVDEKIEGLSKKKVSLERYKKGVMQKLFSSFSSPPARGGVPSLRGEGVGALSCLRFRDENGNSYPDWEEKKLGEIGVFLSGQGFSDAEQGGRDGIPFYKVSDMNLPGNEVTLNSANNYVTQEQIQRKKFKVIKKPSIIFAKVGAAIFLERKRLAVNFIIDNNMMSFTPNQDLTFMKYIFDITRISRYAQVGALPSYNASDLAIIKVGIPQIKEQQKIADFLTSLDEKISAIGNELCRAKAFKKGLLQQMFV